MQPKSSGKATSPPTARVWVNATWSPDAPAKKRTLSLSAAERGVLYGHLTNSSRRAQATQAADNDVQWLTMLPWYLSLLVPVATSTAAVHVSDRQSLLRR